MVPLSPVDAAYRDSVFDAVRGLMPALRREEIPPWAQVDLQRGADQLTERARRQLESSFGYPELVGEFAGRQWEIIPCFGHPAFGPRPPAAPTVRVRALVRGAPPGEEPRHVFPWFLLGEVPSDLARGPSYPLVLPTLLVAARARRQPLPHDLVSPRGRPVSSGASTPAIASEIRGGPWLGAYGTWEALSPPRTFFHRGRPPILVSNFPWADLIVEGRPDAPAVEFARIAEAFGPLLDRLERSTGSPPASDSPIEVEHMLMRGTYRHPLGAPVYICPSCGQKRRANPAVNAAGLPLTMRMVCCQANLFRIDAATPP